MQAKIDYSVIRKAEECKPINTEARDSIEYEAEVGRGSEMV